MSPASGKSMRYSDARKHFLQPALAGLISRLRNNLTVLVGRTKLAQRYNDDPDVAEQLAYILPVTQSIDEILRRLEIMGGLSARPPESVDINQLLRRVVSKFQHRPDLQAVRWEVTFDPLPMIRADQLSLSRAFSELVTNAIEADNGYVALESADNGAQVVVSIVDRGVGISGDVLPHIFEPFFTTKGVDHAGLGLSIAGEIICRHHGDIDVQSSPGEGTRVTVYLPADTQQRSQGSRDGID